MKKVGKATRPFRYDLFCILYVYIVEVTNRFKGLDLIEYLKNYRQNFLTEVCDIVLEAGIKIIPRKRNAKRQSGCLRRLYK